MSETTAPAPSAHELLLALAGWVDDDLLATGRELVAVHEEVPALELLVASLAAGRTALPEPVRSALVEAARALRVEPAADRALPPGLAPGDTSHRFSGEAGPADVAVRVAEVASALPVVARSGARVSLAWRVTPAGTAPGPLPHPVLLAEVDPGGPVEVLAYQLGAALARAGVPASVEAFAEGSTLPPYHRTALSEARPLDPTTEAQPAVAGSDAAVPPESTPGPGGGTAPSGAAPGGATPDGAAADGVAANRAAPGSALAASREPTGDADRRHDVATAAAAAAAVAGAAGAGAVAGSRPAGEAGVSGPVGTDDLPNHRPGTPGSSPAAPGAPAPGTAADETPNPIVGAAGPPTPVAGAAGPPTPEDSAPDAAEVAAGDIGSGEAEPGDAGAAEVSTPARGTHRSQLAGPTPVGGPSGSPSGPAPGSGPFDDGLSHDPATDTPPHALPVTPGRPDGGARRSSPPGAPERGTPETAADAPTHAHPAPRPAPRSITPVPDDPEWFVDPSAPGGVAAQVTRPVPTGDPHPTPTTGPIAVPRGDDALDGPLDRPLLDPLLDRSGGGADTGATGPRPTPDDGGSPAQDEWNRDWATGAWATPERGHDPATDPTPSAGTGNGTRPRLRSVSGPPIVRAPAPPGRPTPGPRPPGHDRPEATGPAQPSTPPDAATPPGPRHRLDVPDPASGTGGDPAEQPRLADDAPADGGTAGGEPVADTRTAEVAGDARTGVDTPALDRPEQAPRLGPPTPEPSADRFTQAQAQHPSNQQPSSGPRPTPRPTRDQRRDQRREPSRRPAPGTDLGGRLTPNEQDLLRRLQEELAARENGTPESGPRNGSSHPDPGPPAG